MFTAYSYHHHSLKTVISQFLDKDSWLKYLAHIFKFKSPPGIIRSIRTKKANIESSIFYHKLLIEVFKPQENNEVKTFESFVFRVNMTLN